MHYSLLPLLLLLCTTLSAQDDVAIYLTNPSFEDIPRVSEPPRGWTDCGFPGESAVDVQPEPHREFDVFKTAFHQNTYLGMVVRDNDTYERVSQQMSNPMVAGQCYELRVHLAKSDVYRSQSRLTDAQVNYDTPAKLQIRGGFGNCDLGAIIGKSPLIDNVDWQEYTFKLEPEEDYTHIVLEAYYNTPILFPYNGNVLVDNIQPLTPVACDLTDEAPTPEIITGTQPEKTTEPSLTRAARKPSSRPSAAPSKPAGPTVKLGQTEGQLRVGQVFAIEDIKFKANSAELERESEEALAEIANFLRANADVVVEIGGHASYRAGPVFAERISEARAVTVIEYLSDLNVGGTRMTPRGYGRNRPVCIEDTPECNERNQRVEVKIVRMRESR
ncbi:OmpA family protein [Neolewinella xylanilytica]|uniref:OmpA family protein n=1 Tax=Neolewinella xylanilytica TaxID=1514080 RepID=A0A2S6I9M2_9BACT|nr:OmpA family protein [Neolewinella xylanilytica]PPK88207.1 OmpA family protein [Neolewinella xylanilytica]